MADKFIALEQDKCEFVYQVLRASGATCVVEAGTSFGVSTIYLALGVLANLAVHESGKAGKVIATEKEPSKAAQARQYWAQAGADVAGVIDLREGDLRETLRSEDYGDVGFVLLDSEFPPYFPLHFWLKLSSVAYKL